MMNSMKKEMHELADSIVWQPLVFTVEYKSVDRVFKETPVYNTKEKVEDCTDRIEFILH